MYFERLGDPIFHEVLAFFKDKGGVNISKGVFIYKLGKGGFALPCYSQKQNDLAFDGDGVPRINYFGKLIWLHSLILELWKCKRYK